MKQTVDYLLVGTGVAPLLAAQRLSNRGDRVMVFNPDSDFFLENSELPLDLLSFETTNTDLSRRFANNSPEQVYRDLISEFPGAIEMWKEEDERNASRPFQVESAPWVRSRHRLWLAQEKSYTVERVENLYLRLLELGLKPRWFEGASLIKQLPGFTSKNLDSRKLKNCVGFIGPRFGDVDVNRYRTGLLEYIRENWGAITLSRTPTFSTSIRKGWDTSFLQANPAPSKSKGGFSISGPRESNACCAGFLKNTIHA